MSIDYTPDNTFIFSYVRMNPPTPGHLVVIKTMIDKAIQLGANKAYVLTSNSLDGKRRRKTRKIRKNNKKLNANIRDENKIKIEKSLNNIVINYIINV
jgi:hypothetical protein